MHSSSSRHASTITAQSRARRRLWVVAGAIVSGILLLSFGWWWLHSRRMARELAYAVSVSQELMDESLTDGKIRKEKLDAFLAAIDRMTEQQRQQLRDKMFQEFRQRAQVKIREYLGLSEAQKIAFLTREFLRLQSRAQEMRQVGERLGTGPPGMGGRPSGDPRNASAEELRDMRRRMLDRTTPEERALWGAFFKDLQRFQHLFPQPRGDR